MILRTSLFLQSLLVNYMPSDNAVNGNNIGDSSEIIGNGIFEDLSASRNFRQEPEPIPDPDNGPLMARFIVHKANWTSVGYISSQKGSQGRALADMFAVSDGPAERGTGIPYFYVTKLEAAVTDLLEHDNQCSLMMSLAQSKVCADRGWDPEDPRCAHVVMTGTFQKLDPISQEYPIAANAVFERHPSFRNLPPSHGFFVAKYNIRSITLQDEFGGPVDVPVQDYLKVKDHRFHLKSIYKHPSAVQSSFY